MALGSKVHIRKLASHPRYNWLATYREAGKIRKKYFKTRKKSDDWQEEREEGTRHSLSTGERNAVIDSRAELAELGLTLRRAIDVAVEQTRSAQRSAPINQLVGEFSEAKGS